MDDIALIHWDFTPCKASKSWLAGGGSEPSEAVTLPHTWNALDTFQPGVRYRRGWGSYRTTVDLAEAADLHLVVGPMPGGGELWVNGKAQERKIDFNWIETSRPLRLQAGRNHIAIRAHNKYRRHMLPGIDEPDFVIHGGLSGPVCITKTIQARAPGSPPGRTAEFRSNEGFFLNGERLELRGVNRHDFIPGLGRGLSREMQRDDARRIKEMGFNLVRLSHYPQSADFLDACDEFGLLVYAEIATWKRVRRGRWLTNAKAQLRDLIERNIHRPSFILMGLANEAQNRKAFEEMLACFGEAPIASIYAENHLYRAHREKTAAMTDVYGVNYELDILEALRDASKNQVLLVSEMSNNPEARRGDLAEELRQCEILLGDWAKLDGKRYVAGWCVWCWADYATMRKKRYLRWSGVVDCWRSDKMAADLLRARNLERPILAIHGNFNTSGPPKRDLVVISNRWPVQLGEERLERPGNGYLAKTVIDVGLPGVEAPAASRACPWHGPHHRFSVEQDGPWLLIRSLDAADRQVLDHSEDLFVTGNVVPWNPEHRIEMAKGEARCPLTKPRSGQGYRVKISRKKDELCQEFSLE